jgi:hypothetical protein
VTMCQNCNHGITALRYHCGAFERSFRYWTREVSVKRDTDGSRDVRGALLADLRRVGWGLVLPLMLVANVMIAFVAWYVVHLLVN